ncbi:hypothetical protein K7432_005987 [Basidiobolus ranarum]|uniref:t-SNARE coiled-coil homology domain-containing protein n=1 Tax=Basidiobolus ranarum TaxID=34480 RepID=A0ABR2WVS8_9FUNG
MSFYELSTTVDILDSEEVSDCVLLNLSTPDSSARQYDDLVNSLTHRTSTISGNVSATQRLITTLGTTRETINTRDSIINQVKVTRELVKWVNTDLKKLGSFNWSDETTRKQRKTEYQKLLKDFQYVLKQFQSVQRTSVNKTKDYVDSVKNQDIRNDERHNICSEDQEDEQPLLNTSEERYQTQILSNELDWHESLVQEREAEIREIERGITELNEIFRDVGNIVHSQQSLLDNIESNVTFMSMNISHANDELSKANNYSRKKRDCFSCMMMVGFLVFFLLLLLSIT